MSKLRERYLEGFTAGVIERDRPGDDLPRGDTFWLGFEAGQAAFALACERAPGRIAALRHGKLEGNGISVVAQLEERTRLLKAVVNWYNRLSVCITDGDMDEVGGIVSRAKQALGEES